MNFRRIVQGLIYTVFFLKPIPCFAHIIAITPLTPFPSIVSVFSSPITANFLVANVSAGINFTAIDKSQLPAGLIISSNSCGNTLNPGQSCIVQLTLNATAPTNISTHLQEWARPTIDGVQFPINVQVSTMVSGLLFAGGANGNVYISANNGAGWAPTPTPPNNGDAINCVFATNNYFYAGSGNYIFYTANGITWERTNSPDGSAINAMAITPASIIYVGTDNGSVYYSTDNGNSWTSTESQPDGSAINSIFVNATGALFAGTANGNVEFSNNNGTTWTAANAQPDGSPVTSIYQVGETLYVGTANEFVYTGTFTSGWVLYAQTVNTLFMNSTGSIIDIGTKGGYVSSLLTQADPAFVADTVINSVFQLSN